MIDPRIWFPYQALVRELQEIAKKKKTNSNTGESGTDGGNVDTEESPDGEIEWFRDRIPRIDSKESLNDENDNDDDGNEQNKIQKSKKSDNYNVDQSKKYEENVNDEKENNKSSDNNIGLVILIVVLILFVIILFIALWMAYKRHQFWLKREEKVKNLVTDLATTHKVTNKFQTPRSH